MDKHYKIEALAEAIMAYSGYAPGSHLWKARNPGGLKAFSVKHESDEHGDRVFASLLDGLQALVFDLNLKLSGKSKVRLKATNTLADLATSYGKPATTGDAWAKFLRKALDADFSRKTPLSYFTE